MLQRLRKKEMIITATVEQLRWTSSDSVWPCHLPPLLPKAKESSSNHSLAEMTGKTKEEHAKIIHHCERLNGGESTLFPRSRWKDRKGISATKPSTGMIASSAHRKQKVAWTMQHFDALPARQLYTSPSHGSRKKRCLMTSTRPAKDNDFEWKWRERERVHHKRIDVATKFSAIMRVLLMRN